MRTYPRTISSPGSHEIVVKKSRFICTLTRATRDDEARAEIDEVKRRFWDSNHNCSAYRIGPGGQSQRSNDDGEPAGSAGAPMMAVLARRELIDAVAIVTRYFGGILLGVGGLIRAHGHADSETVEAVGIVERQPVALIAVEAAHSDAGRLENALRSAGYALGPVSHAAKVAFEVWLDQSVLPAFETWLVETTNGRSHARIAGQIHVEVPISS